MLPKEASGVYISYGENPWECVFLPSGRSFLPRILYRVLSIHKMKDSRHRAVCYTIEERKGKMMKKTVVGICGLAMAGGLFLNACGVHAAGGVDQTLSTPKEAAEYTMESLKKLDLEQLNACTDNYVDTYYNWIGVPVEAEYRVFNDLQQPGVKFGKWKKRYESHYKLSEKMMENLEWEIKDVQEDGDRAYIEMEITNLNMADIMGKYEIKIWENMLKSSGTGIMQMIKDVSDIAEDDGLLAVIESCGEEDMCTLYVTATAYLDNGGWKIHLGDEFINAFMGNINGDEYSEEIQRRIDELEKLEDEKLDDWADELEEKVNRWAGGSFLYGYLCWSVANKP